MTAAARQLLDLGAITESRIAAAFAHGLLLTAKATAELLNLHIQTLKHMDETGLIGGVLVGENTRRYTEADIRAYLAGEPPLCRGGAPRKKGPPCPSTKAPKRVGISNSTLNRTVVAFTARPGKQPAAKPSKSRPT